MRRTATVVAVICLAWLAAGCAAPPAPASPLCASPRDAAEACMVRAGSRVVFTGDYDTGDLDQWATLHTRDWNKPPGAYCEYSACVRDGGPGHPTAARFEVRDGDVPPFGGGERAEVRTDDGSTSGAGVAEGDVRFYELSIMFDEAFQNPRQGSDSWFVLMQWLPSDDSSPPLTLQVSKANTLELGGDGPSIPHRRPIGPVRPGVWSDYVLHVKFSADPAIGFVEVWQDGVLAVPRHSRPTLSDRPAYLKQGVYRDAASSGTQVVWHDGLRVTAP
ncbi:polysaccharide lyase [Mycobacterium sp. NPDC050551]|uniref:polysaccharide lyase n=1 Tax=Mycobacterium sp. NPDC050551 TaxID=3155407 RepID=UPI00343DBECC